MSKNLFIDYHEIKEFDYQEYHYYLILMYLNKRESVPISYYVNLSVEKDLSNHTSLLSLRFDSLDNANEVFLKYKNIFEDKNDVRLLKEIKSDLKNNEWDLY